MILLHRILAQDEFRRHERGPSTLSANDGNGCRIEIRLPLGQTSELDSLPRGWGVRVTLEGVPPDQMPVPSEPIDETGD